MCVLEVTNRSSIRREIQNKLRMQKMGGVKSPGDDQPELARRDTYRIAYIIHFLLGAGNLLPWNALITAVDYFGSLYPNKHVEKVFSVAYMASSLLVLVVMIFMTWNGGSWCGKMSSRLTMNLGFSMFVLSLMVSPVMDWVWWSSESNDRDSGNYAVTVVSVVICGLADGLVGGSLMRFAGRLPKEYMQAVFAGTASSGNFCTFTYLFFFFYSVLLSSFNKYSARRNCFPKINLLKLEFKRQFSKLKNIKRDQLPSLFSNVKVKRLRTLE